MSESDAYREMSDIARSLSDTLDAIVNDDALIINPADTMLSLVVLGTGRVIIRADDLPRMGVIALLTRICADIAMGNSSDELMVDDDGS